MAALARGNEKQPDNRRGFSKLQRSYKLLSVDEDTIESAKIFFDRNDDAPEDSLKIVKYTLKPNLTDK